MEIDAKVAKMSLNADSPKDSFFSMMNELLFEMQEIVLEIIAFCAEKADKGMFLPRLIQVFRVAVNDIRFLTLPVIQSFSALESSNQRADLQNLVHYFDRLVDDSIASLESYTRNAGQFEGIQKKLEQVVVIVKIIINFMKNQEVYLPGSLPKHRLITLDKASKLAKCQKTFTSKANEIMQCIIHLAESMDDSNLAIRDLQLCDELKNLQVMASQFASIGMNEFKLPLLQNRRNLAEAIFNRMEDLVSSVESVKMTDPKMLESSAILGHIFIQLMDCTKKAIILYEM